MILTRQDFCWICHRNNVGRVFIDGQDALLILLGVLILLRFGGLKVGFYGYFIFIDMLALICASAVSTGPVASFANLCQFFSGS